MCIIAAEKAELRIFGFLPNIEGINGFGMPVIDPP